jgi:hypothetical protein
VREKVVTGAIMVKIICSQDQIADTLTKSLSSALFTLLRHKLTVNHPTVRLRGMLIQMHNNKTRSKKSIHSQCSYAIM